MRVEPESDPDHVDGDAACPGELAEEDLDEPAAPRARLNDVHSRQRATDRPVMESVIIFNSDVCGVVATVIPVYLLVLVAGKERLMRPYGTGVAAHIMNGIAVLATLLMSTAEVVALYGTLFGGIEVIFWAGIMGVGAVVPVAWAALLISVELIFPRTP